MASATKTETLSAPKTPKTIPLDKQIAALAYSLWKDRGCPDGSPDVDWLKAEAELNTARQ